MFETVTALRPRGPDLVAAMAAVAQANLVQLQTAAYRRFNGPAPSLSSPGAITRFREALIDYRLLREYTEAALLLRLHEIWGQHCLFCWAFRHADPHRPPAFLQNPGEMRCPGEIGAKMQEISRGLWRLRHEDRLRHLPELRSDPKFIREYEAAQEIPMLVYGRNVRTCSDDDLLACTCEYAGMLAAIRWIADDRWTWNAPGIMELDATPPGRRSDE